MTGGATLAAALRARRAATAAKRLTAGFDGFIDTIARPVRRAGADGGPDEYFATIRALGEFLAGHAEKSCSIELVVEAVRAGGNMPQLARAAGGLGLQTDCIGMLGESGIDPLFAGLPGRLYSYAAPGQSTALEFADGKVFLAPRYTLPGGAWPLIERAAGDAAALLRGADICALVNWSELPFAQALWQAAFDHAFADAAADKGRHVFFDLCDCARKSPDEIGAVLALIGRYAQKRTAILSMNENEAHTVSEAALGGARSLPAIGETLRARFGIDEVLIHTLRETVLCTARGTVRQVVRQIAHPLCSTGAGDHFNGAFCYATAAGLDDGARAALAGRYVRAYLLTGRGPSLDELLDLLEQEK